MPERSHLSIGEVLSLLRDEFPDVTISKIRFLESQGLVDPERTPSGYRKFYEHDVERLRWILRQQREHFLPLKVIRGRLSEQGEGLQVSVGSAARSGDEARGASSPRPSGPGPTLPAAGADPDAVPSGASRSAAATGGPGDQGGTAAEAAGTAEPPGTAQPAVKVQPGRTAGPARTAEPPREELAAPPPAHSAEAARADVSAGGSPGGERVVPEATYPQPPAGPPRTPLPTPSLFADLRSGRGARHPGPPPPPPPQRGPTARGAGPGPPAPTSEPVRPAAGSGSSQDTSDSDTFSADELAAAAGGTTRLVSELEQFGLISTHAVVAGTPYFDASALAVTKAAAALVSHGVEVRHMRIWRNAADRETDLFQQLVGELRRALVARAVSEIR
jgi:DNA-binding transcriptional MerR regulator